MSTQPTAAPDYRFSLRKRLSILFSPLRLTLFLLSIGWLVALNVVYIGNDQQPEWLGPLSVIPVFACVTVLSVTDVRKRREAAALAARQHHDQPPKA